MNDLNSNNPKAGTRGDGAEDAMSEAFTRALLDSVAGRSANAGLTAEAQELIAIISDWLPDLPAALASHPLVAEPGPEASQPVHPDDPIAQMLGLVEDSEVSLDGRRLASVRKAAGLDIAQLAIRLQRRGWEVTISTVSGWERNRSNPPPATINAIAEELEVAPEDLLAASRGNAHNLDDLFNDERIAAFLAEWAKAANVSAETLAHHSKRLLATAGKQNATSATPETILALLQHFKNLPGFETRK